MAEIFSFELYKKRSEEKKVLQRWTKFYEEMEHEDLLDALMYEHDHDFPLRKSDNSFDQLRHKALIKVLDHRAQSEFLKNLLKEIR